MFANNKTGVFFHVHVDDPLAVGPKEELRKVFKKLEKVMYRSSVVMFQQVDKRLEVEQAARRELEGKLEELHEQQRALSELCEATAAEMAAVRLAEIQAKGAVASGVVRSADGTAVATLEGFQPAPPAGA